RSGSNGRGNAAVTLEAGSGRLLRSGFGRGRARGAVTYQTQNEHATTRRGAAEGRGDARGGAECCCVFGVHQDIPRMRAARRLLCRAALLRWTICLLTMLSMIGTATAELFCASS